MAMRYPGLPTRVKTGLLGRYDPNVKRQNEMAFSGGGGGGPGFNPSGMGAWQAPELSDLSAKYLQDIPQSDIQTDPSKLYEGMAGGFRSDVEGAMTEAGQRAISQAATSGREVADVMARYLPEAVKGFGRGAADIASSAGQLAQQGQVAKSELDLKRTDMANQMARFDQAAQQQQHQFMTQLQTEYQMNRERMANNLRVAQSQASSQREIQSINNSHQMQMQQMRQQFSMKAAQYSQSQQNARQAYQLRTYSELEKGRQSIANRAQTMRGVGDVTRNQYPNFTPGGQMDASGSADNPTQQQGYYPNY